MGGYFPVVGKGSDVYYTLPHWDGRNAVDIFAPDGTPCVAVEDMICQRYTFTDGGFTVIGRRRAAPTRWYYYAHLREHGRQDGLVPAGHVLGLVSNSGNAYKGGTGAPHCHFTCASTWPDANGAGDLELAPLLKTWERLAQPLGDLPSAPCDELRAQIASLETRLGVIQGDAEGCVHLALRRAHTSLREGLESEYGLGGIPPNLQAALDALYAAMNTLKDT